MADSGVEGGASCFSGGCMDQGSQGSSPETKALGDLHSLVRQSTDTHSTAVVHHPLHHSTTRTHRLDPSSPATCIQNLSLRFEEDSTSNHFCAVLDVTQHFTSIHALQLSFFDASNNASHYNVPCDEHRTVPAKQLTVSVYGPDPDDLLVSSP
jgi:hypothetical protein